MMPNTIFEPLRWSEKPARVVVRQTDGRPAAYFQVTSPMDLRRMCLGRPVEELPRIVSLVSPSHHLVSAMTLDNLFGVVPPEPALNMRVGLLQALLTERHLRKLYFFICDEQDPFREFSMRDEGGYGSKIRRLMLDELMRCIDLAQEAATILGGRAQHPVSAVVGGVGRSLKDPQYERLEKTARECFAFAVRLAPLFAENALGVDRRYNGFFEMSLKPMVNLSLSKDGTDVAVRDGKGNETDRFPVEKVFEKVGFHREPWTYEPFAYLADRGWNTHDVENSDSLFLVGPLARLNGREELGGESAEQAREELGVRADDAPRFTVNLAFRSLLVEVVAAAERMVDLYRQENFVGPSLRTLPSGMGNVGVAAMESPSGLIAHRYEVDEQGLVRGIDVLDTAAENNALRCFIAQNAVTESAERNLNHKQTKSLTEVGLLPF